MKSELQIDIVHIIGSIVLAIISKIVGTITGSYTLFAIINLISLVCFVFSIIGFIQHKYRIKILGFSNKQSLEK